MIKINRETSTALTDDIPPALAARETDEETWLLGQPALWEYLDFVRDSVVDGDQISPAEATAEWRAANAYYETLEKTEAGIADTAECHALDRSLVPLAKTVEQHPTFAKVFDTMPVRFGMVELDKLVLCQKSVTSTFVQRIMARIGPDPSPEAVFHACMPLEVPDTPVQMRAMGENRFVFRAPSTDFRFHQPTLLRPHQLANYTSFGPVSGVVGLVVGFGANLLNVIKVDNRLLLHNGYHRACALQALGVTHVPCVITDVSTQDELEVTAKSSVTKNPDFYFKGARPPILRDFEDPRIRKVLTVHRHVRIIEVNFEVKEYLVPE